MHGFFGALNPAETGVTRLVHSLQPLALGQLGSVQLEIGARAKFHEVRVLAVAILLRLLRGQHLQ